MRAYTVKPGDSPASIAIAFAGCPKCSVDLVRANPAKPTIVYPNGYETFVSLGAGERLALPDRWFDGSLDAMPQSYFAALPAADGRTPSASGEDGDDDDGYGLGAPEQDFAAAVYQGTLIRTADGNYLRSSGPPAPQTTADLVAIGNALMANWLQAESAAASQPTGWGTADAVLGLFRDALNAIDSGLGTFLANAANDVVKAVGKASGAAVPPPAPVPDSWLQEYGSYPAATTTFDAMAYASMLAAFNAQRALPPCQSVPCPANTFSPLTPDLFFDLLVNVWNAANPGGQPVTYTRRYNVENNPSTFAGHPQAPIVTAQQADPISEYIVLGNSDIAARDWTGIPTFTVGYTINLPAPTLTGVNRPSSSSSAGSTVAKAALVTTAAGAAGLGIFAWATHQTFEQAAKKAWRSLKGDAR